MYTMDGLYTFFKKELEVLKDVLDEAEDGQVLEYPDIYGPLIKREDEFTYYTRDSMQVGCVAHGKYTPPPFNVNLYLNIPLHANATAGLHLITLERLYANGGSAEYFSPCVSNKVLKISVQMPYLDNKEASPSIVVEAFICHATPLRPYDAYPVQRIELSTLRQQVRQHRYLTVDIPETPLVAVFSECQTSDL